MIKLIEALRNAGISVPTRDTETFKIVRWGRNNRYWLKKFDGGYVFGDFVTGLNTHIFEQNFSGKKLKEAQEKMHDAMQIADSMLANVYEQGANKALSIWHQARTLYNHKYLETKKIASFGLKEYKKCLVVPISDQNGKLWSLQFIDQDGKKRFLSGCKKKGCYFTIGSLEGAQKRIIQDFQLSKSLAQRIIRIQHAVGWP